MKDCKLNDYTLNVYDWATKVGKYTFDCILCFRKFDAVDFIQVSFRGHVAFEFEA